MIFKIGNNYFEFYHKIDQFIFNWELLETDITRRVSKHEFLLKVFFYSFGVRLNVHE